MENCVEREGYALAAGLALGLVCAGAARARSAQAAPLANKLRTYMLGGDKHPLTGKCFNLQRFCTSLQLLVKSNRVDDTFVKSVTYITQIFVALNSGCSFYFRRYEYWFVLDDSNSQYKENKCATINPYSTLRLFL